MAMTRLPSFTHSKTRLITLFFLIVLPLHVHAQEWGSIATISATLGIHDSRICVGEGSRSDIGCPEYAPTVSPTGVMHFTAGLATSFVSLTTAGVTWGYLSPAASFIPYLGSNAISTTNISLSTINGLPLSSLGGSATKLASLTDVSFSTPALGDVLRYNSSHWVNNQPIFNGVQTSDTGSIYPNWPDAILCEATTHGSEVLFRYGIRSNKMMYAPIWLTQHDTYYIEYDQSGNFIDGNSIILGACSSKSISQLYTERRAFNFTGHLSEGTSTYGVTSGTTTLMVNGASNTIDLSTISTTWGYLSVSGSYLPNFASNHVSSTTVSSTLLRLSDNPSNPCTSSTYGMVKVVNGRQYTCRP